MQSVISNLEMTIMRNLVMNKSIRAISKELNVSRYRVTKTRDELFSEKETPNESLDIRIYRKILNGDSLRQTARDLGTTRYRVTKVRNTMNFLTSKIR